jgi:diguanylate cyclase (GGDEF)-like protein
MTRPLRLLLVEDSDRDAAHVMLELRRGGFAPEVRRVETKEELSVALDESTWDAVVCDFHLPRFSAPEALDTLKARNLDIPFIVVSGAIGEDTAVELMRGGAHDYLLKDRLARLHVAVEREIDQASLRRAKRRVESLFQAVLRASPLPSAIVERDTSFVIDGSNAFARQFLGGATFPIARPLFDVIQFSQRERIEQLLTRGSGVAWHTVYYIDGVGRVANVRCHTVEHEGGSYGFVVIEDVTEQHYLKASFDAIGDAVLVIGADQRLLYANRAAEELFGQLYFGMDVQPLLNRSSLATRWWVRRTASRFEEQRIVFGEQPYAASSVVFRFAGESESSTILTLRNIAEEEELQRLATHDALTGAYNVRYFGEILPKHIAAGGALALIDLDHFKPINDELGHAAGDAALITFANLVRNCIRSSDVFARLGGDEFAIIFAGSSAEEASEKLREIHDALSRTPLRFDGATRALSASCGVAVIASDDSVDDVKSRADHALYDAKRQGRGRFVVSSRA